MIRLCRLSYEICDNVLRNFIGANDEKFARFVKAKKIVRNRGIYESSSGNSRTEIQIMELWMLRSCLSISRKLSRKDCNGK